MDLSAVKTALSVITGTDIGQVLFDWYTIINETRSKTYPIVLWDLGSADILENNAKLKTRMIIDVYCSKSFAPNTDDRVTAWQSLKADLYEYFTAINNAANSKILINDREIPLSLYEYGLSSVDLEIAIKARVTLDVFC